MIHDVALPVDDRATYVLYLKGEMGGAEEQREEVDDGSFSWETSFLPAEYRCCPPPPTAPDLFTFMQTVSSSSHTARSLLEHWRKRKSTTCRWSRVSEQMRSSLIVTRVELIHSLVKLKPERSSS